MSTLSLAQSKLADLLAQRQDLATKIESYPALLSSLDGSKTASADADAALRQFDSAVGAALAAWVTGGQIGPRPASNAKERAALVRAAEAAKTHLAAENVARQTVEAEYRRMLEAEVALSVPIASAVATILAEEAAPLVTHAQKLRNELTRVLVKLNAFPDVITGLVDGDLRSSGDRQVHINATIDLSGKIVALARPVAATLVPSDILAAKSVLEGHAAALRSLPGRSDHGPA